MNYTKRPGWTAPDYWTIMWKIAFPLMLDFIGVVVVLQFLYILSGAAQNVILLTSGGPGTATLTLGLLSLQPGLPHPAAGLQPGDCCPDLFYWDRRDPNHPPNNFPPIGLMEKKMNTWTRSAAQKIKDGSTLFVAGGYFFSILYALLIIIPLYFVIVSAFKDNADIITTPLALPDAINFQEIYRGSTKC